MKVKLFQREFRGENKKTYTVTYEDGKEIHRILKDEEIIQEPSDRIVAEGIFDENSLTVCVNQNRTV